jgi:hypothetical protein
MEKQKRSPSNPILILKYMLVTVAVVLWLIILCPGCVVLGMMYYEFSRPLYYNETKVTATCANLHLSPDSDFCSHPATSIHTDLRTAIETAYPVNETSINTLTEEWDIEFELASESCKIEDTSVATCPVIDTCGTYTCYAHLPVDRITIFINSQGVIQSYSIVALD